VCNQTLPDITSTDGFAQQMLGYMNGAALGLMISIGHRTGLFDTMSTLSPSTSEEIANAAGLNERYVREWLGALTTGKIVNYNPQDRTYDLPAEHAEVLTRTGANTMASFTQWISVLGGVEDRVVACFRHGGGVPYSEFRRFHEVMAEESHQTTVSALEEHILPLVPGLIDRLKSGAMVLDLGCGAGRALITMAGLYPRSTFVGYDFGAEAVETAREEVKRLGLKNITFEVRDAARIKDTDAFDVIFTFDSVHDQADPEAMLRNIYRSLRSDGVYLMQDIKASSFLDKNMESPLSPFLYTISTMHCMTVSLSQGGRGLGAAWGEELAQDMLAEAGFRRTELHQLPHDIMNNYYISYKK